MRGKIHIKDKILTSDLWTHIRSLKDGIYDWEVKRWDKNRSNDQNSYYHGVVIKLLSEHTGYDEDDMHEILKSLFLSDRERLMWDKRKKVTRVKSTSTLTTVEFEQYLDKVRKWAAAELGVYIPLPNEPPSWTDSIPIP